MQNELLTFERSLYRAVIRFKEEHPGELEARTKRRREESHATDADGTEVSEQRLSDAGV